MTTTEKKPVTSDMFSWDKKLNVMSCELSTVEGNGGLVAGQPNVLDIRSERTGRVVSFVPANVAKDGEGEIMFYTYVPLAKDLQKQKLTVQLWND